MGPPRPVSRLTDDPSDRFNGRGRLRRDIIRHADDAELCKDVVLPFDTGHGFVHIRPDGALQQGPGAAPLDILFSGLTAQSGLYNLSTMSPVSQ